MQVMHSIVLPCHLITVFWLLCLQVKVAGPYSHFDWPLWRVRPSRVTLQAYRLLMQIGQLEPSSSWFIQCKLQKFRFDFRGSIILVFKCIIWKEKQSKWQGMQRNDITLLKVIITIQKCLQETKHYHQYE